MARTTARRMSQLETVQLAEFLKTKLRLLPKENPDDEQLVEYIDGYDDEKAAKSVSPDLGADHARGLRNNIYGKLFVKTGERLGVTALNRRVDELERSLEAAHKALADLIIKHDKLCQTLTMARVHDVKHLVVNGAQTLTAAGPVTHR